ncbi:MAG: family 20 glycosylhydrolase, partial [Bacteroidales bacterium]|nr:family 20 glycosylhydrolase [Bacteroidales bacterium]
MKKLLLTLLVASIGLSLYAQSALDSLMPVRGLAVAAPRPAGVDDFVKFIDQEFAPNHINMLILRVEYNYAYESHPELRDENHLTKADVKKLVNVCRKHNIQLIPLLDLLGHQSYRTTLGNLLRVYPEFDETPNTPMPTEWNYPNNPGGLIMKSYCPRHPDVHRVVFNLVDELLDVFEADWFHAGMDEVFFIGEDQCLRCRGADKAELFAEEVRNIHSHLKQRDVRMMIWGDRLLDGRATGTWMWEGSMNNTHRAIDMIPKDVFICDWHYDRADLTPVLFAAKGFDVAICPWRKPDVAVTQFHDILLFRQRGAPVMNQRFRGVIQTAWGSAE